MRNTRRGSTRPWWQVRGCEVNGNGWVGGACECVNALTCMPTLTPPSHHPHITPPHRVHPGVTVEERRANEMAETQFGEYRSSLSFGANVILVSGSVVGDGETMNGGVVGDERL